MYLISIRKTGYLRFALLVVLCTCCGLLLVDGCHNQSSPQDKTTYAISGGGGGSGSGRGDFRTLFTSMRSGVQPLYPEDPIFLRVPVTACGEPEYPLPLRLPDIVEKDVFPDVNREKSDGLSMLERLFAFGWVHKNAEEWWSLTNEEKKVWLMEREDVEHRGFWVPEVDPVLEIARRWVFHYLNASEKLTDTAVLLEKSQWEEALGKAGPVMKQDILDRVTSPVTGNLIEIGYPEFSRGNMVIDALPMSRFSAEDLGIIYDLHVGQEAGSVEGIVLVAYRVYGETGVIRTGFLICSLKDQKILSVS